MFRKQSTKAAERVIVNEEVVDVASLRAEAKRAGTRFWVLVVLISMLSSMVVPYLSMASVAANGTAVFDGEVIPGYSMGGIDIASYGVDLNDWAKPSKQKESNPAIVKSQYGYWTKNRAENASANLVASKKADAKQDKKDDSNLTDVGSLEVNDEMMSSDNKARGWIGITRDKGEGTGLSNFSQNPLGDAVDNRHIYNESVAPYRTLADYTFWNEQTIGGTSASITTTIYPDFVIVGWDKSANKGKGAARVLTNPDSTQNGTNSKNSSSGALADTAAVPHYIPLSTLFKEFGISDTVMGDGGSMISLETLMDKIAADANKNGGSSPILDKIVKNEKNSQENDLLLGTHYDNLNGANASKEKGSDAWNPYPYSMVFKMASDNGTVVSSIYGNNEGYVYFSPRSVYNNYMTLRAEYDALVNQYAPEVADGDPAIAFQLGYYLAGMSILEAYLNEALPQDMTRGYVGPTEGNPLATGSKSLADSAKLDTRSTGDGRVAKLFQQTLSGVDQMITAAETATDSASGSGGGGGAVGFKSVPYSQLMYDFADSAIVKYKQSGQKTRLGATSAIMNTLSTYGYGTNEEGELTNGKNSAGQGPNRGMTRRQTMARITSFGPYGTGSESLNVKISKDKDDPMLHPTVSNAANTGMYVPVYYPIQQHVMPTDPEMAYRFQVLSLIPYNTLAYELGKNGFNKNVSLSYTNNALENLARTKNYYNKNASLAKQLDDADEDGGSLSQYDKSRSIVLNPQTNASTMVGDKATKRYAQDKDLTDRVDNALRSFTTGRLNSDNVHDLVDVVRAIPGVKYETFVRYYNPIKSSGGANDIFLTRVTPAQTAYMPSILTKGYESAGGTTNSPSTPPTTAANFDYFSIPSFAPCFAAHTSEDTYYGALTYELRPFYTADFLSSLPADSNVPALEQWEEAVEEEEEISEDTAIEGIKEKIVTVYVLAKRLAFANAYSSLMAAQDGKEGAVSLGSLYYATDKLGDIAPGTDAVKKALTPNNLKKYNGPETDSGKEGVDANKQEGELPKEESASSGGGTGGGASDATTGQDIDPVTGEPVNNSNGTTANGNSSGSGSTSGQSESKVQSQQQSSSSSSSSNGSGRYINHYVYKNMYQGNLTAFRNAWLDKWIDQNRGGWAKNGATRELAAIQSGLNPLKEYNNYLEHIKLANAQENNTVNRLLDKKKRGDSERIVTISVYDAWGQKEINASKARYNNKSQSRGNIAYTLTQNTLQVIARAHPVASGDYIGSTDHENSSQMTSFYDDGNGTSTSVAYVNTPDGWVPQAESSRTQSPSSAASLGTGSVNGVPVTLARAEASPDGGSSDSTASGPTGNEVPATQPNGGAAAAETSTPAGNATDQNAKDAKKETGSSDGKSSDAKSSDKKDGTSGTGSASQDSSDSSKDAKDADSKSDDSNSSDSGSSGASASVKKEEAQKDSSNNTGDGPYADNGGEADKIYTKDGLGSIGYIKATNDQWKKIAGKHVVGDSITFHIPKGMTFKAEGDFDHVMQQFGQKHIIPDGTLGKRVVWCRESNGYAFVTSVKSIFAALYKDSYNRYLAPGGSYYWDKAEAIAGYGTKPETDDSKDDEVEHYNTVAMERAKANDAATAKGNLDTYCDEAFEEAGKCLAALAMLNDEMPAQMQNVLAWADTQTASESESNYLNDPADANATLVAIGTGEDDSTQAGGIHSFDDLQMAGFKIITNNGEWAAVPDSTANTEGQPSELQSRMVRGVANTTYTASMTLAAYTMTATVGRIDRLVSSQSSSSSIPYSGIYSGNLNSGTERYALLQAHSIDRQSISSRLAGDLRSRSTSGTMVALSNPNSTAETQNYVRKTSNIANEFLASSGPTSINAAADVLSTVIGGSDETTTKTLKSSSDKDGSSVVAGAASLIAGTGVSYAMAEASTFNSATMNRQSASTQTFNTSSRKMVATSGASATASAAPGDLSANRDLAQSLFIDGALSDVYATIQSIALIMVLAFLMIIAFQNFVGYTSGKEKDYIDAQTKLKSVLPRSLIAVAMIGLPPLGSGTGFQGGCFLLLQIVSALVQSVLGAITENNGPLEFLRQIGSTFTSFGAFDIAKLLAVLLNLLAGLIVAACSVVIIALVTLTDVILFLFWGFGPIAWAFYVWPYGDDRPKDGQHGLKKLLGDFTGKMGSKTFTNGQIGRDAPLGWLMGYITALSTTVKWTLVLWVVAIIYGNMHDNNGNLVLGQMGSQATSQAAEQASDVISFGGTVVANVADDIFGNLLRSLLFALVTYLMFRSFKNSMGGLMQKMYGAVGGAVNALGKTGMLGGGKLGQMMGSKAKGLQSSSNSFARFMGNRMANAGKMAETMSTVANSQAGAGIMHRINMAADNMAKAVPDRADSSGAFDNLLSLGEVEEKVLDADGNEVTDEKGRTVTRKRKVIKAAPELAMAGQLTKAAVGAQYQSVRALGTAANLARRATQLASDPEYRQLAQQQAIIEAAGAMSGSAGTRVANFAENGGALSAADIKQFGNHLREQVGGEDGALATLNGYAKNQATIAASEKQVQALQAQLKAGTQLSELSSEDQNLLSSYKQATAQVAQADKFANLLGTEAATLAEQYQGIAESDQKSMLDGRIDSVEKMLVSATKEQGTTFRDLTARKDDILEHHQDKLGALEAVRDDMCKSGVVSEETMADFDKIVADAKAGRSTSVNVLTATTKAALKQSGSYLVDGGGFVEMADTINAGAQAGQIGTTQFSKRATEAHRTNTVEPHRVIAQANADLDGYKTLTDDIYLNTGATTEAAARQTMSTGTRIQAATVGGASGQFALSNDNQTKQLQKEQSRTQHKMGGKNARNLDAKLRAQNGDYEEASQSQATWQKKATRLEKTTDAEVAVVQSRAQQAKVAIKQQHKAEENTIIDDAVALEAQINRELGAPNLTPEREQQLREQKDAIATNMVKASDANNELRQEEIDEVTRREGEITKALKKEKTNAQEVANMSSEEFSEHRKLSRRQAIRHQDEETNQK